MASPSWGQHDGSPPVPSRTVLVLGDSLSAAYKLSASQGWVSILASQLAAHDDVMIHNASVSGMTTSTGLQMLPGALKQYQPQFVVIELGANDGLQGKPVPFIRKNLSELITLAKQADAKVLLLAVRLPPNRGSRYTEPFFNMYQALAAEHNVALVPFFLDGVAGHPELMQSDALHPNAEGQKHIAAALLESFKRLLELH